MAFPSSSTAFARSTCDYPDITRDWLHQSALKTRYRTAFDGDGNGVHPSTTSFTMHEETHVQAGRVIRDLHNFGVQYARSGGPWTYRWTGLAGAKVCKPGYHRYGAAIDFTRFDWGSGNYVDTALHGKDGRLYLRRRYLAVIATCRKHFGTVLHCNNDPDGSHWNHIHADRGRKAVAANWGYQTDTTIIQWAARDLAGVKDMVIDGDFGPKTKRGYEVLREQFGTGGIDPTASGDNFRVWLDLIGRHGIADKPAGTFRATAATTAEAAAAGN
ncbi:hypothetical protein [Glycomyces algeriensis]|uniref:Extensin-like protein n=1 Tax=Glycomyces algeriensis TaxID=256037 RepID=A0A9W6G5J2_9ACTN|nr:hypothetical protein [Glycomyces algeriensis]MDA1367568.1 hypothetical protein [Glycomyces algeriensis]MDR7353069.1 hypothetical protein [Glycomyces algeriensis]GLI40762.1 hypothetical protein GALLR39Z86_06120 [Glycomyces algeriensis]